MLTVCLLLVSIACGHIEGKTVVKIIPWGILGGAAQSQVFGDPEYLFKEYQKLHPDIGFELIEAPMNTAEGVAKLILLSQSGEEVSPDIVAVYLALWPEIAKFGLAAPMPEDMAREASDFFFPQVLEPMMCNGRLSGFPTEYMIYALAYNQHVFAECGMADVPTTWPQLRQAGMKLKRVNSAGDIERYGFDIDTQFIGFSHTFLSLLWSNNGFYLDQDGQPGLTRPEAYETAGFMRDLVSSDIMPLYSWWGTQLLNGNPSMSIMPNWGRGGLLAAGDEQYRTIATSLIPHGKGDFATFQYGWGLFVSSTSKHQKEAWEFLRWLMMESGPDGLTYAIKSLARIGSMPTNPHDLDLLYAEMMEEPFYRGFIKSLQYARPEPNYPVMSERQQIIGEMLLPALKGEISLQEGLENMENKIVIALRKAMSE